MALFDSAFLVLIFRNENLAFLREKTVSRNLLLVPEFRAGVFSKDRLDCRVKTRHVTFIVGFLLGVLADQLIRVVIDLLVGHHL